MEASLPVFIDLPEKNQAQEIRQYLNSAGADLGDDSRDNIQDELCVLLDACDNWLKSASDADLEAVMNSFISLILFCTNDAKLTKKFVNKLVEMGASESNALLRIKILNNLFIGLPPKNSLRYDVYIGQLNLSAKFGHTVAITMQLPQVKELFETWSIPLEDRRVCYRLLHSALKYENRSEEATYIMLELLSAYDEHSASQAKDDAKKCILDFIAKPDVYIMDHLLQLKPVTVLKDDLIFKMLDIFVYGQLSDYDEFHSNNENFIKESGLNHASNVAKMRVLTMLTLANQEKEISFRKISQLLRLSGDDLEDFIIELVKTHLLHVKLDQINEKIIVRSTSRRTFGRTEWQVLHDKLSLWSDNVQTIKTYLDQVVQG